MAEANEDDDEDGESEYEIGHKEALQEEADEERLREIEKLCERAETNPFLEAYGGFRVDLERKAKGKAGYYALGAPQFHYAITVPVDADDLEKNQVELLEYRHETRPITDPKEVIEKQRHEEWLHFDKTVFRLDLSERERKELLEALPRTCGKCGYERFQNLQYVMGSAGPDARFQCPHCGKETELNWSDKW